MNDLKTWHILTGEYPPDHGGVSDYTRSVAVGLSNAGIKVHVWTRGSEDDATQEGIVVHRCLKTFGLADMSRLHRALQESKPISKLLVQYVPHGFGMRAMNIPLTRWIDQQSRTGIDVRLMLHELSFPFVRWPLHHNLIAIANRWMLRNILFNVKHVYVSTTAWQPMVDRYSRRARQSICLPIPSNIPGTQRPESKAIREKWTEYDLKQVVVGHFGTFGGEIRRLTIETISRLFESSSDISVTLIGRGATSARLDLLRKQPTDLSNRVFSLENANEETIAAWIQACDIMLQPFPDGISTRRTSAMAGFANGVAVVSNMGALAESFWLEDEVAMLADGPNVEQLAAKTLELVGNSALRERIALAGRSLHDQKFTIENTIRVLMDDD